MSRPKSPVSLVALCRRLNVTAESVVRRCELESLPIGDANGRPVRLSFGLAETIGDWHRGGLLTPAERSMPSAARERWIATELADMAERGNSCVIGLGDELEAMIGWLRDAEIDPLSVRGRRLLWRGWRCFAQRGLDYERWKDCDHCRASYKPRWNRQFVNAYLDAFHKCRRDQRKADRRFYYCGECGGLPHEAICHPDPDANQ